MDNMSLWEMIEVLGNAILSSPVYAITLIIGIILLIALILSIIKYKKIPKLITILTWIFLIEFVVLKYNSALYNLFDNLMNNIFIQIFFPSLVTYVIVFIIANIIMIYTLLSKQTTLTAKILNTTLGFIIWFLSFMAIEVIAKNKINIYKPLTVYTNKNLLVFIELVMIIFTIWILVIAVVIIIKKLIKMSDKKITEEISMKPLESIKI